MWIIRKFCMHILSMSISHIWGTSGEKKMDLITILNSPQYGESFANVCYERLVCSIFDINYFENLLSWIMSMIGRWGFGLCRTPFVRWHVDVQGLLSAEGHGVTLKSLKQQEQQYQARHRLPAASILEAALGTACLSHWCARYKPAVAHVMDTWQTVHSIMKNT